MTSTHTRTVASRSYDNVYDTVYTSSNPNLGASKASIERVPNSANMFSESPLYPNHSYRAKNKNPLPKHMTEVLSNPAAASTASLVTPHMERLIEGSNRYRYFRRPNVPFLHPVNPEAIVASNEHAKLIGEVSTHNNNNNNSKQNESLDGKRSVGIQTVYRDGEVQTDPYTPDYTVRPGEQPEILTLATLTYNYGLPAGLSQVEMIERARKKHLFESTLPPMTDDANLELRKQMVTSQEMKEWTAREEEIDKIQAERLELLQTAIEQRDKENAFLTEQRVEALRQAKLEEKDLAVAQIQRKRIKALRKLSKARKAVEPKAVKRDIIMEYSQFDSIVYAPRQISGKYPDITNNLIKMDPPDLNTVQGLTTIENSLPKKLIAETNRRPSKDSKASSLDRKEKVIEKYLDDMDHILKADKMVDAKLEKPKTPPPAWKKKTEKVVRPPTPNIVANVSIDENEFDNAIITLQKLLRGRAVQNRMFEGREKRSELIKELRLEESLAAADSELQLLEAEEAAQSIKRETAEAAVDALYGEVISSLLDFTTKHLVRMQAERRIASLIERAENERRRRENEEGGRRQAEDLIRQREDNMFHQIVHTHQATVESLLDNIISETSEKFASHVANLEINIKAAAISPAIDSIEVETMSDDMIVRDLVGSFLLPEVDRKRVQEQVEMEEKKYTSAVRSALSSKK